MAGIQPSINDRDFDLLKKIVLNSAALANSPIASAVKGVFTLTGGAATVADTSVTANSVILTTIKTVNGTRSSFLITPNAGVGFSVSGGAGTDNGTYNYAII